MNDSTLHLIMLLGGIAFVFVTLVLYTLAHQLKVAITRHDLIREARQRQRDYILMLEARRRGLGVGGADEQFNVDIVDDEAPVEGLPAPALAA